MRDGRKLFPFHVTLRYVTLRTGIKSLLSFPSFSLCSLSLSQAKSTEMETIDDRQLAYYDNQWARQKEARPQIKMKNLIAPSTSTFIRKAQRLWKMAARLPDWTWMSRPARRKTTNTETRAPKSQECVAIRFDYSSSAMAAVGRSGGRAVGRSGGRAVGRSGVGTAIYSIVLA